MNIKRIRRIFERHGAEDVLYYESQMGTVNVFYHKKEIDSWNSLRRDIDSMNRGESIVCWQFEAIESEDSIEKIERISTQLVS